MKKGKREHSAQFKVKVVLDALRGDEAIGALAARHEIHPTQINKWKRRLLDALPGVFGPEAGRKEQDDSALRDQLFRQIGELQVENSWLKKNWGFDAGATPRRSGAGSSAPFAPAPMPSAGGVALGNVLSACGGGGKRREVARADVRHFRPCAGVWVSPDDRAALP